MRTTVPGFCHHSILHIHRLQKKKKKYLIACVRTILLQSFFLLFHYNFVRFQNLYTMKIILCVYETTG